MPRMAWEEFLRDHHRPHLLVVEANDKSAALAGKADFERLALALGVSGNYAIQTRDASIYAAFEGDADATRFATVLRPERTSREWEWASKAVAHMDGACKRRISTILTRSGPKTGNSGRSR
jgi:hypothetical protein